MTDSIYDVSSYKPTNGNNFFFDANIWLSIYGPIGAPHDWRAERYSKFLSKLQNQSCNIYTNSIIVSEYVNRFSRMEFEQQRELLGFGPKDFKIFRKSTYFEAIASEIEVNIKKIVKIVRRCDHEVGNVDLIKLASDYKNGYYDFNDLMFVEICRDNNLILVTHDGDFKDCGIEIVTANTYMLKK